MEARLREEVMIYEKQYGFISKWNKKPGEVEVSAGKMKNERENVEILFG